MRGPWGERIPRLRLDAATTLEPWPVMASAPVRDSRSSSPEPAWRGRPGLRAALKAVAVFDRDRADANADGAYQLRGLRRRRRARQARRGTSPSLMTPRA